MKLNIKGKEITLKYSFRSLMIYENITNKSFNPQTLSDMCVFMYSCILACDKDMNLDFNDFIDYLDEHPTLINEFSEWLTATFNKNNFISAESPTDQQVEEAKEESEKN